MATEHPCGTCGQDQAAHPAYAAGIGRHYWTPDIEAAAVEVNMSAEEAIARLVEIWTNDIAPVLNEIAQALGGLVEPSPPKPPTTGPPPRRSKNPKHH